MKRLLAKAALTVINLLRRLAGETALRGLHNRLSNAVLYREDVFEWRVRKARELGVKVGRDCRLFSMEFSTEPYLIEIGDHVVIGSYTQLVTHDGGTWVFHDRAEMANSINVYGKIKIGNNVFIGIGCIILCNVEIGDNCVVGAGSVVRSNIPANSVAAGNPARVLMTTTMYEKLVRASDRMMTHHPWNPAKHAAIKDRFGVA